MSKMEIGIPYVSSSPHSIPFPPSTIPPPRDLYEEVDWSQITIVVHPFPPQLELYVIRQQKFLQKLLIHLSREIQGN